jgi:hypothetical protein
MWAASTAILSSIGTTLVEFAIICSSLWMDLSGSPLLKLVEATSANAIDGVKQSSASTINFAARRPLELPRKISTHANVSMVRFKAIGLSEGLQNSLRASESSRQGPCSPLPDQLTNSFVSGAGAKNLAKMFQLA